MNIQTERLENHTARFTVEVDVARLEDAKREAARKLAKRVNIPGFRKGKAPYKVLLSYVGEGALLEDAIEVLGNEIYKTALDESGIDPYGPGELENFDIEPSPTFTFVVPLQPTVELNDYRTVRLDFTPAEVTDEDVNASLRSLQRQQALVEESQRPVELGNQVTMDIHGTLIVEEGEAAEAAPDAEAPKAEAVEAVEAEAHDHDHDEHNHEHEHDHHHHDVDDNTIIHQHDGVLILDDEDEPAPGFNAALVGAAVGEERVFEVTYPDDAEKYEEVAGKNARFYVTIKKIENITMPSLNDDLAARITADEETPLTLLELRMRVRENLQTNADARVKSNYANQALTAMTEKAAIAFPEALINEQIDRQLARVDQELRRQGLTLEDYLRITNKKREDLYPEQRDNAVEVVKRSLVLREIMEIENIDVETSKIDDEINRMVGQFGDQAESFRSMFDTPAIRDNVRNDLIEREVMDRIAQIAKGEAPELVASVQDEAPAIEAPVTQADDEASTEQVEE